MGQKVNPIGFRVMVTKDWRSKWYADKRKFKEYLKEDIGIRDYIKGKLAFAGIPRIDIERSGNVVTVALHAARPGLVIGRKGAEIDKLKEQLTSITKKEVKVEIKEVKNPETNSQLVAENIAGQIEKRISHKRAMKKAVSLAMDSNAEGIKILCSGRLGGNEIARSEGYKEGKIPLHTLRSDIDYGFAEARTTYGAIGVKVWICKGEKEVSGKNKEAKNAVNA
ncbi:MAG: 30S ribosomal protein S3 [bacterium]|nr:30S ribosomal protein S3 [bacterium]